MPSRKTAEALFTLVQSQETTSDVVGCLGFHVLANVAEINRSNVGGERGRTQQRGVWVPPWAIGGFSHHGSSGSSDKFHTASSPQYLKKQLPLAESLNMTLLRRHLHWVALSVSHSTHASSRTSSSNSDNLVDEGIFQSLRCARPYLTEEACSHDHPTCQLGCFLDGRALAKKNINICTSTQSEMRSPPPQQESCPHQKRNGIYPLFVPRSAQKMHSCGFTVDTSREPAARARPQQETRCQLLLSNTGRQKRPKVRTCAPHQ